ncbi:alkaline phosphatase [Pseudonocardia sichuanensis]
MARGTSSRSRATVSAPAPASSSNNATLLLEAGRALDAAVEVALRFQAEHPDTLVLVTGDHETGGLAVEAPDPENETGDGPSTEDGPFTIAGTRIPFVVDWSTSGHTGEDVPVSAGGPGAAALEGVVDNTAVYAAMVEAMRLTP